MMKVQSAAIKTSVRRLRHRSFSLALATCLLLLGCQSQHSTHTNSPLPEDIIEPSAAAQSETSCQTESHRLDADFPGGALGRCRVLSAGEVLLDLEPESTPINPSPWYSFSVSGNGPLTISLNYGEHKHRYQPKLSRDNLQWISLSAEKLELAQNERSATFTIDPGDQKLYVSAQENMHSGWYQQWMSKLLADYPDMATFSIGTSVAGKPLQAIATNPAANNSLLLVGRQHPPEVTGAIAMQYFIERLLAGHPNHCVTPSLCEFYRNTNIVFVPLMNPDGVDAGHWRHNFGGLDTNRDWGPFSQPETQAIKRLIDDLATSSNLRLFLDFHSTYSNLFYTQSANDLTAPADFSTKWLNAARAKGAYAFSHEPRHNTTLATSKNYMYARFGIPAITFEVGDETSRTEIAASAGVFADTLVEELLPYQPALDTLITGGTVIDGSGSPGKQINVGLHGDRIVYVGPNTPRANVVVDASGLYVTPGFVDPHTHAMADLTNAATALNEHYLRQGVTTVFTGNDGDGAPYAEAAAAISKHNSGTHTGLWIGHGHVRSTVVGADDRPATPTELSQMQEIVRQSVAQGAIGLSSGLFYAPGSFATTQELILLARAAASAGGSYDSHIRDEADYNIGLISAIDEVIQIAESAQIPAHIAHIKALGPSVQGQSTEVIARIEAARAKGLRLTADQYPWLASGTRLSNALIPRWAQDGGDDSLKVRLADDSLRAKIVSEMQANLKRRGGAGKLLITGESPHRGSTLLQAAQTSGEDPLELALDIIINGDPAVASFMMSESDVDNFMVQPWVMTGSDGSLGHPRKYGSFPEKYAKYVRERQLISVPEFVHRSTRLPSLTFGLCERGIIAEGMIADVAIWHPEQFRSNADYANPTAMASGVLALWVAGTPTLRQGKLTGKTGGYVLRRNRCQSDH